MLIDLDKFIVEERPYWDELDRLLSRLEDDMGASANLEGVKRLYYLYQRCASDLAKVNTFAAEPALRQYLESLVGRAYGEIHEVRGRAARVRPVHWCRNTFPRTFRRHRRAFHVSLGAMMLGALFAALIMLARPDLKAFLIPPQFGHLYSDPSERVAQEEASDGDELEGFHARFSAMLIQNNTRVSILTMGAGLAWGLGSLLLLFQNGLILGAVAIDYILAGESVFLLGWLLPHGAVEIPCIILAGQAGLVLGGAIIGHGDSATLRTRLRRVGPDLVTLIAGVCILLIWAGIVEAFLSQYHEPHLPYALKIAFGATELVLLALYLFRSGLRGERRAAEAS